MSWDHFSTTQIEVLHKYLTATELAHKEIIFGLQIPLSWIEDVKVVVPDAENETLSSLQILLDSPSDVSVSNNQFDKLLDLINDLGSDGKMILLSFDLISPLPSIMLKILRQVFSFSNFIINAYFWLNVLS